ncbi:MAG: nicotinate-nucleotide--dimethylbenzimidazole phosphoribosyltransferase [Bauldia sp.]|nr:nicotinate-nucleotide--dimethylbenzimidazole phosphoribosyltransferase [Bauldia sp.]
MPPPPVRPLDDIRTIIAGLPAADRAAVAALRERRLGSPAGELGAFEDILAWLAAWQGKDPPTASRPQIVVFAGNHGVAARHRRGGAAREIAALAAGTTTLNRLCQANGIGLKAFDLALETATADSARAPAMSEVECAATIAFGMEAAAGNVDLLAVSGIGDGSALAAAAIGRSLFGGMVPSWLDRRARAGTAEKVADAVGRHLPAADDVVDLARRLGGRETAAIIGAILAARIARVPVLVDGLAATVAAALLQAAAPAAIDHCRFTQPAAGRVHRRLLDAIGARPVLDTAPAGPGIGSVLAIAAIKAMVAAA